MLNYLMQDFCFESLVDLISLVKVLIHLGKDLDTKIKVTSFQLLEKLF